MEELKVIVELISQLGEQGKEAFIWRWFFFKPYFRSIRLS